MTVKDIIDKAKSFKNYKYWYGGKGEIATKALADRLKKENPTIWSTAYYNEAIKDIDGTTRVADCSHLVCAAYGIGDISSYGIHDKYTDVTKTKKYDGVKTGMILWRKGHVGIYDEGIVHQMKGIYYDYYDEPYIANQWTKVLYDKNVDYNVEDTTKCGWHKDDNGWWYRYKDGTGSDTYYHDIIKVIGGHCYIFDSDGYIASLQGERFSNTEACGWIDN